MNPDTLAILIAKAFIVIVFVMGMSSLFYEIANGTLPL